MKKTMSLTLVLMWLAAAAASAQTLLDRDLPAFSSLSLGLGGKTTLQAGDREHIRIEGTGLTQNDLEVEVRGGRLVVGTQNNWDWKRMSSKDLRIVITYKALNSIDVSGSGQVTVTSPLKASQFEINISGSANLTASLEANALELDISGSGGVTLAGQSKRANLTLSGSGQVNAFDLKTEETEVSISGSGGVDVSVSRSIETEVSGSGDVRYKGNPDRQVCNNSGSGSCKRVN
jgi:Putative auto-transporter adhesin, head GIN domain